MAGFIQLLLSHPNKIFILFFFLISLFLFHTTCLQAHLLCTQQQSSALLLFKSQFSFTNSASYLCDEFGIPSYSKLKSWKEGTDCCSWDGVECDTETSQVVGLDLRCSWLQGTICSNNTLFHHHFPHLQRLNLAFNDFQYSRIPSAFTQLTQLTHLNLSFSQFSGQVPIEFSFLNKLVSLDLSYNDDLRLLGIGFEFLVQNLTKIRELYLDGVNISTVLPNSLLNLTSLTYLSLPGCGFHGKFLPGIFQLPHLKALYLLENMDLTGYFPKFLNSSSPLQYLYVSRTSFFGELPDAIGNLKSLEELVAGNCQLYGSIPMSLGNLTKITLLGLSSNNFTGTLPSSFSNLINLKGLVLAHNHFHGKIIDVLPSSKLLSYISLQSNNFSGPLSIENLTKLENLVAMDNRLTSLLPMQLIGRLVLRYVRLGNNLIKGSIPSWIFTLPSLELLDLSHNKLTGPIKVFQYPSSLRGISLDYNNLNGMIPSSMCNAIFLKVLRLSNNQLSGSISQCLGDLGQSFEVLDLSSNNLTGIIPLSLGNLNQSLRILDLSKNSLSGSLPRNFGNFTQNLLVLNLQMNEFFGTIPDTFANGNQLTTINFHGNRFEGAIPKSLVNCRGLEVLDLGSNMFFDEFPRWLDNLPDLHVLILRSNKFYGPILTSKTKFPFPKLRVIDMSKNNFSGPLPKRYLENFKALMNVDEVNSQLQYVRENDLYQNYYSLTMIIKGSPLEMERVLTIFAVIDLSRNNFQGNIPEAIGRLNSVRGLNLSHNRLSGHIPASLENLRNLEWLDLSSNKLTGKIPQNLANLGFLQVLNLSRNQLSGPIPQGKQFDTFLNDSYIGNLALCGTPLSNACSNTKTPEPPPSIFEDSQSSSGFFNWEVILPGYGCGLVFGIVMGYLMFSTGKPQWFVRIIEREEIKSRKRPKKLAQRHRGRRN